MISFHKWTSGKDGPMVKRMLCAFLLQALLLRGVRIGESDALNSNSSGATAEAGAHMTVVGNVAVWRNHNSGKKENTCAADDATKTDAKNQYGDAIGVTCCNADGTKGSRPGCKKSTWEDAKKALREQQFAFVLSCRNRKGTCKRVGLFV
jgi:hypothetical protein